MKCGMKCLIVERAWVPPVLDNRQLWVLRAKGTDFRGEIGLVPCQESPESGTIVGTTQLIDVLTPTRQELDANVHKHHISEIGLKGFGDKTIYALVLKSTSVPLKARAFDPQDDEYI